MNSNNYPKFKNQNQLLWGGCILHRKPFFEVENNYNSVEDKIVLEKISHKLSTEYKQIIQQGMAGLYLLLIKAFDGLDVGRTEILADGLSNASILANYCGLTGVGAKERIEGILVEEPKYYTELFFGKNNELSANPSCIRVRQSIWNELITKIAELLKHSENYKTIEPNMLYDHEVRAQMGLYIMPSEDLVLRDLEYSAQYRHSAITLNDEKTLNLFRTGAYNNSDDGIKIPFINDELRHFITKEQPESLDDIAKAIGKSFIKPEYKERDKVFREDYYKDLIEKGEEEAYSELHWTLIKNQIMSRVHIDSTLLVCYKIAYYQIHFPSVKS